MPPTPSTPARRGFLQAGAALAAASAAGLSGCTTAASALHGSRHLEALRSSMAGRLIPGEEGYYMATYPNNARWAGVMPKAIAMCANEADVQLALRWAREQGEPFAIRCGGHSYAGFSTTSGLLINVRGMNKVTFDAQRRTACRPVPPTRTSPTP